MQLRHLGLVVVAVAAFQGTAHAEMISGTISGIDPQARKMTIVRQDNASPLTLSVKDQAQLLGLQPGNKVVVDANRKFFGGWKVESVTMSSSSQGDETALNAAENPAQSAIGDSTGVVAGAAHPESAGPTQIPNDNNPNPTSDTTY